jgi:hypothetical protein
MDSRWAAPPDQPPTPVLACDGTVCAVHGAAELADALPGIPGLDPDQYGDPQLAEPGRESLV